MKIGMAVLLILCLSVSVLGNTLMDYKGTDWETFTDREKELYIAGYLTGRLAEVIRVSVLPLKFYYSGYLLVDYDVINGFVELVNEMQFVVYDMLIRDLVVAVDIVVLKNYDFRNDSIAFFMQHAFDELGIEIQ